MYIIIRWERLMINISYMYRLYHNMGYTFYLQNHRT